MATYKRSITPTKGFPQFQNPLIKTQHLYIEPTAISSCGSSQRCVSNRSEHAVPCLRNSRPESVNENCHTGWRAEEHVLPEKAYTQKYANRKTLPL